MNNFSSKLIEEAVNEFSQLPGIGKKTALRFVLYLMKKEEAEVEKFSSIISKLKKEIKHCTNCHNISDKEICEVCSNNNRDQSTICVVEDIRDVMAIESTYQYKGVYHVLGGVISPMDGIGPNNLTIDSLIKRVQQNNTKEIILALSTTMEGDTTNFYIYKKLKDSPVQITTIARGIAIGDELEYADEITLGRSILNRTPYEKNLITK